MHEGTVRRVLMTGDTVGGVWTFTLELAKGLAAYGIEVTLAAMGGEPGNDQRADAAAIPNLRLFTSGYKLEWMNSPWEDMKDSGRWLLEIERRFVPDAIHLNTYGHGSLKFGAPTVMTAHSCAVSWWKAVRGEPVPERWERYRGEVEKALRSVDFIAAPSYTMLRTLEENYGAGLPPGRVVANGCNTGMFYAPNELAKKPAILAAGRLWDEAKNIAAVAGIAGSLPWPVYLAGDMRHPDGTEPKIEGCRVLGRLAPAALARWYRKAAIYLHPARYEPFGLCVAEAALSGCALVLGDIASLRELWDGAAVFVPPDEPERMKAALEGLIASPELRAAMSCRAMARARKFTAEQMAEGYLDVYRMLAARRRAAWRNVCAS